VYPDTGHAVHREQPRRAAPDLVEFLDLISTIDTLRH